MCTGEEIGILTELIYHNLGIIACVGIALGENILVKEINSAEVGKLRMEAIVGGNSLVIRGRGKVAWRNTKALHLAHSRKS